ncbi:MAG: iron ABC transporter substrate-binding protein [Dehalococcoidia bacterium]|nr:iron ABC transporter substrate-binding protein [Dehalococcoidia bacterium]
MIGVLAAVAACGGDDGETLTIYSGRSQSLVQPLLEQFSEDTGVTIKVRYGETAQLAATILEEGDNSPADVFFAQDAGALGALADEGRLAELPADLLALVPEPFRSPDGLWVGASGRARVVAYNTENVSPEGLPDSILDFTDPEWKGRIGWAPTNGSFQAFVTGLRVTAGEETAREWLEGIEANDPTEYANNVAAVEAVARGEVDVAFVNHYYLFRFLAEEGGSFDARNYYLPGGDPGALVNVAGAAVLDTADSSEDAERFIDYLLSPAAQQYFADETFEYPLIEGVETDPELKPLSELEPPNIDLSDLSDLEGTLDLLRETGVLP